MFPSVNVFKSLYSSRQRLYLSNSIFSKISIKQILLNVKKYHCLTLKNLLHRISPKETREIVEKIGKIQKKSYIF